MEVQRMEDGGETQGQVGEKTRSYPQESAEERGCWFLYAPLPTSHIWLGIALTSTTDDRTERCTPRRNADMKRAQKFIPPALPLCPKLTLKQENRLSRASITRFHNLLFDKQLVVQSVESTGSDYSTDGSVFKFTPNVQRCSFTKSYFSSDSTPGAEL